MVDGPSGGGAAGRVELPGLRSPGVGLDSPFAMLEACHERVERSLHLLARLLHHLDEKGSDDEAQQAARDVLRYFDLAAPLHHQDEELHVFPAVMAGADAQAKTVVQELQSQHRRMETLWAQLRLVLLAVSEPSSCGWQTLLAVQRQRFTEFAELYGLHLAAEEGLVYPLAQALLAPAAVQTMSRDMMQRRGVPPPAP